MYLFVLINITDVRNIHLSNQCLHFLLVFNRLRKLLHLFIRINFVSHKLKSNYLWLRSFRLYLAKISRCMICNIFFKGSLKTSMISLPYHKEVMWRPSTSYFHDNPVVWGQPFCSLISQKSITLSRIQYPQQHNSLFDIDANKMDNEQALSLAS